MKGLFQEHLGQEMQMMAVIYYIISRETGRPERPGTFRDYGPAWDFNFDIDVHDNGITLEGIAGPSWVGSA
jgi:hypothetical protein